MLSKNGELILKSKEITNTFNDHFGCIVDNVGLDHGDNHSSSLSIGSDRVYKRYKNYSSIKNIKAKFNRFRSFSFQPVLMIEVKTVIWDMKNNESVGGKIPIKILTQSEFAFDILANFINKSIETGSFSDSLKEANITSIFKKDNLLDKSANLNSILPQISKV